MDTALTPREIQSRIRAGESVDDVAADANASKDSIAVFAGPVLAERAFHAETAQKSNVRRRGSGAPYRPLGEIVRDRLAARGIAADSVEWDAWRTDEKYWSVQATYSSGSAPHAALFQFDPRGKFSIPLNEDARWLVGELTSSHGPQPGRKRRSGDPDNEPTLDLNDPATLESFDAEIWEAVGALNFDDDSVDFVHGAGIPDTEEPVPEPEAESPQTPSKPKPKPKPAKPRTPRPHPTKQHEPTDTTSTRNDDLGDDLADTMMDDIALADQSNIDVLYDMLSGLDEDSIRLFMGTDLPRHDAVGAKRGSEAAPEPAVAEADATTAESPAPEETPAAPITAATPKPKRRRKKRASVPSWDEIMFGAAKPDDQ